MPAKKPATTPIPVPLSEVEFSELILPHLSMPRRGPRGKLGSHHVFNLILPVLYSGMPWKSWPVPQAPDGTDAIPYTTVYQVLARCSDDGSLERACIASVTPLWAHHPLDLRLWPGDGTHTVAQKGGDGMGDSAHNPHKGEKVIAMVDNPAYLLTPLPVAAVHETDTVLLPGALQALKRIGKQAGLNVKGVYVNLDGGLDSTSNGKAIFNAGLMPNVKEKPRHGKRPERGRQRLFNQAIDDLGDGVERGFAWEDKFKRLLRRFEHSNGGTMA